MALAIALALFGCTSRQPNSASDKAAVKPKGPAPEFELENVAGGKLKALDLKGKVSVIDFWATWCEPCIAEIPKFNQLHEEYPNVQVIGITVMSPHEDIKPKVKEVGMKYTVLVGNDDVADGFGRGYVHTVNRHVAEARFGTANLHVLAFAFVALERDAGQAADGISNVGVGETVDHFCGKDLDDFVGQALDVDGFGLALHAFGSNDDLIGLRSDSQGSVQVNGLSGNNFDGQRVWRKSHVGKGNGIVACGEFRNSILPLIICGDSLSSWMDFHKSARQRRISLVFDASSDSTSTTLPERECGKNELRHYGEKHQCE